MVSLPGPGDNYWRFNVPYKVERVEPAYDANDALPVVHLCGDPDRQQRFYELLEDGWELDAGRQSETGVWTAQVLDTKRGIILGDAFGEDADAVVIGGVMAKKTVIVSDMSGATIDEGKGAVIAVRYNDARRGQVVLDVTDSEADAIAVKGRKQARRGRKPKES